MCGFSITKKQIPNLIKHRGLVENRVDFNDWSVIFNSLPLESYGMDIEQPFESGKYLLMFNGEIFNYKELNPRAKTDVHFLKSLFEDCKRDPIKFYERSGNWDGFWSIAIINTKGEIWAFTDPLGKKQLYHNSLGIASEIKQILDSYSYFTYTEKFFGTLMTNFSSVERCLPGYLYRYEKTSCRANRVPFIKVKQEDVKGNLYDMIDGNVKRRLSNKIDGISVLLSGGLDSNIVLHHALKYNKNVEVVSLETEEKEDVIRICDHYGLDVKFIPESFNVEDLTDAVSCYEHSLDYGSLMPNYLLFKNCKNHCVLTGDGADEIFSGYSRCVNGSTWQYDVFMELPYYHNIRIDRTSMRWTKEARSPLMGMNLVKYAKTLPSSRLNNKQVLRDLYGDILPSFIVTSRKKPLRYLNDKYLNMEMVKNKHNEIFNLKIK